MSAFEPTVIESTTKVRARSVVAGARRRAVPAGMMAAAGALLVVLAASSCAKVPIAQDLIGMWASQPVVTPRGSTSETFCFAADGSVEWNTQTPVRTMRIRGTYKIAGDVLTIESPDMEAPTTLRASLSLGKLELTSKSGSTQKYSKVPGTCDERSK